MKKWIFAIVSTLMIIGASTILFLFYIPHTSEKILPSLKISTSSQSPQPVFIHGISKTFENLTPNDLPSVNVGGYRGAVQYKDTLFALGKNHVLQYDLNGNLIAFTDQNILNCPWPELSDIALIKNLLFVACQGKGIYEIDLQKNQMGDFYNQNNGLPSVTNLQFAIDGNDLWIGTFDQGVVKMNINTKTINSYKKELGILTKKFSTGVRAKNGDIWVIITADWANEGGLSHYNKTTNSWKFYTPKDFKTRELERIDFDKVIVSEKGVFVEFQNGGPDYETLSKYNSKLDHWEPIFEASYQEFYQYLSSYLPQRETYLSIDTPIKNNSRIFSIEIFDGKTWKEIPTYGKEYTVISEPINDTRYLAYSGGGIDIITRGNNFPTPWKQISSLKEIYPESYGKFFTTPNKEYTVLMAPDINLMENYIKGYIAIVISNSTREIFEKEIKNNKEQTLLPESIEKWNDEDTKFDGENIFLGNLFQINLKTKTISINN